MANKEIGHGEAKLDDVVHSYQYEIENTRDTNFDLTVWYKGQVVKETCPRYLADPHKDVQSPHGPLLLAKMLGKKWTP